MQLLADVAQALCVTALSSCILLLGAAYGKAKHDFLAVEVQKQDVRMLHDDVNNLKLERHALTEGSVTTLLSCSSIMTI